MHESPLKLLLNRHNKYIIFLKSAIFALLQKYQGAKFALFMLTIKCKYGIMQEKGDDIMSTLKELRIAKGLTQEQASVLLGVSLRSYKTYENDEAKIGTLKYNYMLEQLEKHVSLDEEHGILTLDEIKSACKFVLDEYPVKYCILFGSYSKGVATEKSDVDLLISTEVTGLRFFGIAERLRTALKKKVDLLDLKQLSENRDLIDEILKDGIKVYEQSEK